MIEINIVKTNSDLILIEQLANTIWREHYIPIIGVKHVEYMLEKYQTVNSMKDQIENGSFYYLIYYKTKPVGYLSFSYEADAVFLSKIYVLNNFRGKKIGKAAMLFVENSARDLRLSKIYLTVNKDNLNSIKAYEKLGYRNTGAAIKDIGEGFIMDDYKMEKIIKG